MLMNLGMADCGGVCAHELAWQIAVVFVLMNLGMAVLLEEFLAASQRIRDQARGDAGRKGGCRALSGGMARAARK